MILNNFAKF